MIAKSNLKKVSLKSVGAVVASGALVAAMAMPAFAESYTAIRRVPLPETPFRRTSK